MDLGKLAISLPLAGLTAPDLIEVAQRAEREWGYPALWTAETGGHDSLVLAGAIAAATERIEIGTGIVPVYNRTPAVLASAAATIQELAGGRFILGLGTSSHSIIENWNGVPFEKPLARVRESVQVIRQAIAGERTDVEGKTLRSVGYRLGVRLPDRPDERGGRLPIYLAALRPRMLELAGEIGDGLVVNLFPVTALPRMLDAVRTGAERAGRDLDGYEVVCRFQVGITDDRAATREIVRQIFTGYAAAPVYNKFFAWCGFEDVAENVAKAWAARDREGSRKALTDDFVDRITILGSAEECRDQLAEFVAAGVTTPIIQPLALGREASEAVLRTFAPAR